jgi:hypothetical protein
MNATTADFGEIGDMTKSRFFPKTEGRAVFETRCWARTAGPKCVVWPLVPNVMRVIPVGQAVPDLPVHSLNNPSGTA